MFIVSCNCRAGLEVQTTQFNVPLHCPDCGREIVCVTAEALDDAAASADFDAAIIVAAGSTREGQMIALGGCATIKAGSGAGNAIVLAGDGVAETHFKLDRVDFGPSRWQISDASGGAGVLVNGQKIASHELQPGDTIEIGEYELLYQLAAPTTAPMPDEADEIAAVAPGRAGKSIAAAKAVQGPPRVETNGPLCPSCEQRLGHGAKICVACGIRVPSGRPLMTSEGLDENIVHGNSETAIRVVSWFVWITPLPIPLASSAYGRFKPFAIWAIAAITIIASIAFLVAQWNDSEALQWLMLWPIRGDDSQIIEQKMNEYERTVHDLENLRQSKDGLFHLVAPQEYREKIVQELRARQFHPYQLITCTFLHDPGSLGGFILHLGGNLLFLIVFGSRVNAIIGNIATAIIYPLLAVASSLAFLATCPANSLVPLVGASGAINGLAGMYLVLLPAHYVYCGMWCRIWGFRFNYFVMKVFALRGFWILLIYFAFDITMVLLNSHDHTAHWAHIGGFVAGFLIGVALLVSRMFNCRNGDLLSVILGKYAWPLIGKPNRWAQKEITA